MAASGPTLTIGKGTCVALYASDLGVSVDLDWCRRMQMLEWIIILLIAFEIVLSLVGH